MPCCTAGGTLLMAAILRHYVEVETFLFASVPRGPETAGIRPCWPPRWPRSVSGVNVGSSAARVATDTYPRPYIAASVILGG